MTRDFRQPAARARGLIGLALVLAAGSACGASARDVRRPEGPVSQGEAQRYIKRGIRSSTEGVILLPSKRAESVFEQPRLNEIAHDMRRPMAHCFIARAVTTMERTDDPERAWSGVPEGQLKIRTRINPAGQVVRAEVLESGFSDPEMEPCLTDVVRTQSWPQNKTGNTHFIDVVYWVSLGRQGDIYSEEFRALMRREQAAAGVRAKGCLQGRVDAGSYEVNGLNLVDNEGATMANRVMHETLPRPIRQCIAEAMRTIRLARDSDAFVRPVATRVSFVVDGDGTVHVGDEQWLKMVELEERALAAKRAADLADQEKDPPLVDELPGERPSQPRAGALAGAAREPEAGPEPVEDPDAEVEPEAPKQDPGQGGLRLDLGAR